MSYLTQDHIDQCEQERQRRQIANEPTPSPDTATLRTMPTSDTARELEEALSAIGASRWTAAIRAAFAPLLAARDERIAGLIKDNWSWRSEVRKLRDAAVNICEKRDAEGAELRQQLEEVTKERWELHEKLAAIQQAMKG